MGGIERPSIAAAISERPGYRLAARLAALSVRMPGTPGSALEPEIEQAFHEQGINTFLVHPMMKTLWRECGGSSTRAIATRFVLVSDVVPVRAANPAGPGEEPEGPRHGPLDAWLLG